MYTYILWPFGLFSYEISYNGGEWIKIDDGDVLVYYSNCKWYGYGGIRKYIE